MQKQQSADNNDNNRPLLIIGKTADNWPIPIIGASLDNTHNHSVTPVFYLLLDDLQQD